MLKFATRSLAVAALLGLVTACQSPTQTAGTTTGVVAGALVGGPVGAVVGGVAGAAVTAPGAPLAGPGPGACYVTDRYGNVLYNSRGQPRLRRC